MRKGQKRLAKGCGLSKKQIRQNYRNSLKGRIREALEQARYRAKKRGVPFNLTVDDIATVPEVCPVLNIPLQFSCSTPSDNSPSLDCIVPELGYVRGMWLGFPTLRIESRTMLIWKN
jgi:hypothetical protein